jgi:hypothetical protein
MSTHTAWVEVAPICGFMSGDSNLSKLTIVFATLQLTGPSVCSRLVMPIPLGMIQCLSRLVNVHWNVLTTVATRSHTCFWTLVSAEFKKRLATT